MSILRSIKKSVTGALSEYAGKKQSGAEHARHSPAEARYEVIVGNVGTVYDGPSKTEALTTYDEYLRQSRGGYGRAAAESVTLMKDGDIVKEVASEADMGGFDPEGSPRHRSPKHRSGSDTRPTGGMFKVGSEETAAKIAAEERKHYGWSIFNGGWYVGTPQELKKIGVSTIKHPTSQSPSKTGHHLRYIVVLSNGDSKHFAGFTEATNWGDIRISRLGAGAMAKVYGNGKPIGSLTVNDLGEVTGHAAMWTKQSPKKTRGAKGIYNVSKGRFVSYVGRSGKMVPVGYPR